MSIFSKLRRPGVTVFLSSLSGLRPRHPRVGTWFWERPPLSPVVKVFSKQGEKVFWDNQGPALVFQPAVAATLLGASSTACSSERTMARHPFYACRWATAGGRTKQSPTTLQPPPTRVMAAGSRLALIMEEESNLVKG